MDLLLHFRELGMNLGYLVFDGEIIGYALGEVKREVLYIHQEKGLKRFGGVYQKLVSEFAKAFLAEATIINREDDNGDLGLRTSKIQYNPSSLVEKYALYVENPLDLCSSIPQLLVDQYTLMGLREKDKEVYYELALDKELNQYWGYDIEKDLIHPTPQYVYEMMEHDLEKKEAFSWIIYQGDILIGEVVCYHLKCDSSCEIGMRIKKEYQGKGIATKAVQLISHYLLKTLKLKTINAKCFKENQASRKVLIKDGYQENGEDDTYFFFQKEEKK